ncbi:MAG: FAD-dependent oxidoreductase [Verrucomicrobiota bacterium]
MARYDVCVIGAGPAGISLALELAQSGLETCLLESGGAAPDTSQQELNGGEYGNRLLREDIGHNRSRVFGGTTIMWTGYCAPLEEDVFPGHPEIPFSSWPIRKSDLDPFYQRSEAYLDLPPGPFKRDFTEPALVADQLQEYDLEWRQFKLSLPTRFLLKYLKPVQDNPGIELFLNTTLKRLKRRNRRVEEAIVDREGVEESISANAFVLATGGIEATRNLLLFKEAEKPFFDDSLRSVGHFFATHPHFQSSRALLFDKLAEAKIIDQETDEKRPVAIQLTSEKRQREAMEPAIFRFLWKMEPDGADGYRHDLLKHLRDRPHKFFRHVMLQSGMRLMRESRITLSQKKDRLGQPFPKITLQVHPETWRVMDRSLHDVIRGLGATGQGRIRFSANFFRPEKHADKGFSGGHHHLCSTRMAESEAEGAVDSNLRVFGTDNLYVSGASSFASTGSTNPTMTIVALSLRLAAHLKSVL